jgi:FMN-dependent oxidoreductase (nitrilotriacetate monooxygenase family)
LSESEIIHLAADLSQVHANLTWNYPGSWEGYPYYGDPAIYLEYAAIAERGIFDLCFFADTADTSEDADGNIDDPIRYGLRWPKHDPMPMAVAMAMVTARVGFAVTMSTTYQHPFHLARLFNTLDHVTRGRIAWNAVTSAFTNEAMNWGYDALPDPTWRYDRAEEHLAVVHKLWDSVGPDTLILDRETGQFGDPSQVHLIDHVGEHYKVRGPLPCLPSPQGKPVIFAAGQSPRGLEFVAKYADCQFAQAATLENMVKQRARLDQVLVANKREIRDLGVMWALRVEVVDSAAEARERERKFFDSQPPAAMLWQLSHLWGLDLARRPEKTTLGDIVEEVHALGTMIGYLNDALASVGPDMTLREYAVHRALHSTPNAIGTPEQVADRMEELHHAAGANGGFSITRHLSAPGTLREFVDRVVPELQRRGLTRSEYQGPHLRDNLLT